MNELFDLRPTNKEVAFGILFVFLLLVGVFTAGYLLGIDRAGDVHNNGGGTASIGNAIGNASSDIGNAADGINAAQGHADNVGAGIESAKEQVGYIHSTATTSAGIIAECQQIIAGIRSRGKADPPAN